MASTTNTWQASRADHVLKSYVTHLVKKTLEEIKLQSCNGSEPKDQVGETSKDLKSLVECQKKEIIKGTDANSAEVKKSIFKIFSINLKENRKLLGVEFAPISIPFERRLQTFAVLHLWAVALVSVLSVFLGVYALVFTPFRFIVVLYISWLVLYDWKTPQTGGRRSTFFRNLKFWNYFKDYFPISLHKTTELNPKDNYIIGYHPHGLVPFGALCNFGTEATEFSKLFPGIKCFVVGLNFFFNFPIVRDYLMACGFCNVSRESIHWLTTKNGKGNAVVIIIGGVEEALETRSENYELTLKSRKGFCRMALQSGSHLVPCYSFGENKVLYQLDNPKGSKIRKFQNMFRKIFFGFPPILIYGRGIFNYSFGFMPLRKPIAVVVGEPIIVSKIENPTAEAVNDLHRVYIEALSVLFNEHKEKYGLAREMQLKIV